MACDRSASASGCCQVDFTLCQQFTLIGCGLIWNIYFASLALIFGFFLATAHCDGAHLP